MSDILHYTFMQNALMAAVMVSIISGIIGSLILVNKMTFLTGGIAHSSYGGIGLAIYFGLPIFFGASLFAIFSAIIIAFISFKQRHRLDIFIGLVWAVGMAIGVILVDLTPGYNVDLMSYLFGSILAVSYQDLTFMATLLLLVLFFVHRYYREILAVSYDSEYASLRGINSKLFFTLILILSALAVVVAIKVVGLILVIALMTIPTYIAEQISNSLYSMMFLSALLSTLFTVIGLLFSYNYDLTSGASIILTAAAFLILFLIVKALLKR
ncbi:MAG TPA: metal ABC transporter permease [Nitratifractor sp.]|nr:metal ABC transporter permease [Nitratifractor sp.]